MHTCTLRILPGAFVILALLNVVFPLSQHAVNAETRQQETIYLPFAFFSVPMNCEITSQTPQDGSFVLANEPIEASWTIRNLSDKTWLADNVDIRHTSGVGGGGADVFPMQYDVSPLGEYQFKVTLNAQSASGDYTSNWALFEGDKPLCRFYVQFRVP